MSTGTVGTSDPKEAIKTVRMFVLSEECAPEQLVADYFQKEADLLWPAATESALARRLCQAAAPARGALPPLPVPETVLARPSGTLLEWLLCQRFQIVSQLQDELTDVIQRFTAAQRVMWVRGWAHWPATPVVPDPPDELVAALRSTPSALGWATLPLLSRGHLAAAREAARLWERTAPAEPEDLQLAEALLTLDDAALQATAVQALRRLALRYSQDQTIMLRLCRAAQGAGQDELVLFVVELALPFAEEPVRWNLEEARISALAALGVQHPRAREAAVECYRQRWHDGAPAVSDPADLLHSLDELEDDGSFRALRRRLVENADRDRPEIELEYRGLIEQQWADVAIQACDAFFEKRRSYYLFRTTEAVAETAHHCPLGYDTIRLLVQYWEGYRTTEPSREPLVQSAQFLLASATHEDARLLKEALGLSGLDALTFARRTFLRAESLPAHWLVGAALRRVIELYANDWGGIAPVVSRYHARILRLACRSPEEFDFFRLMGELTADEFGQYDRERWCRRWEELLALPIDYRWLLLVLQRFDSISSRAASQGNPLLEDDLFWEVERQLLWRGKATGEQRLAVAPPSASGRRQRLLEALNEVNDVRALWGQLQRIDEERSTWN